LNFLEDNKKLVLVHRSMPQMEIKQPINVMLTPQFYTLKKEILPIKFAYQAKRIAASLFEGMVPERRTYDYFVYKEGDQWVFIAYSLEEIIEFLQSKGLYPESISKLFFAQQAVAVFREPYLLSDKEVLGVVDDKVVVMPRSAVGDEALNTTMELPNPTKGIAIQSAYASVLSLKEALGFAAIFLLFSVLFIAEGVRYGGDTKAGTQELESLIEANPSLSSQYTRESIAAKYRKIDEAERKKRETIKVLLEMISKGVELQALYIDEKGFRAEYAVNEPSAIRRIESQAKKAKFTLQKSTEGIKVEGRL